MLIDEQDKSLLDEHNFYVGKNGYLVNRRAGYLHRLIMKPAKGFVVDHINGDKLDNRRQNLRICKQGDNARNTTAKGWWKKGNRFVVQISIYGKRINVGRYNTQAEAEVAYQEASRKHLGKFSRYADRY